MRTSLDPRHVEEFLSMAPKAHSIKKKKINWTLKNLKNLCSLSDLIKRIKIKTTHW